MSFKADFTLKLRPKAEIMKETMVPIAVEYIKAGQEIVAHAAKNHGGLSSFEEKGKGKGNRYINRSVAGNTARIGWALSAPGKGSFGSLTTNTAGKTSAAGKDGPEKPPKDQLVVIVASSSGYGGWLEIGWKNWKTKEKVGPFPYIRPAFEIEKPKLLRRLEGVIK